MRDIAELPGITVAAIELLREAGIKTVEQFIDGDVSEICKRIKIAGQYSSRGIPTPTHKQNHPSQSQFLKPHHYL